MRQASQLLQQKKKKNAFNIGVAPPPPGGVRKGHTKKKKHRPKSKKNKEYSISGSGVSRNSFDSESEFSMSKPEISASHDSTRDSYSFHNNKRTSHDPGSPKSNTDSKANKLSPPTQTKKMKKKSKRKKKKRRKGSQSDISINSINYDSDYEHSISTRENFEDLPIGNTAGSPENQITKQLSSHDSPSEYQRTRKIDVLICEKMFVKMKGESLSELKIIGEVSVQINPPVKQDSLFYFGLNQNDLPIDRVAPNKERMFVCEGGVYGVKLMAGEEFFQIFKYKVKPNIDNVQDKIPILAKVNWACQPDKATIDIDYKSTKAFGVPLKDIKLLINMCPENTVSKCPTVNQQCYWNQQTQTVMWKVQQLPLPGTKEEVGDDTKRFTGKLHCECVTSQELEPSPLVISFVCDNTSKVLSGLTLGHKDPPENGRPYDSLYTLNEVHYSIKSGNFTVA